MVDITIFSQRASGLKVTAPQRQRKRLQRTHCWSCVNLCVCAGECVWNIYWCVYARVFSWAERARKTGREGKWEFTGKMYCVYMCTGLKRAALYNHSKMPCLCVHSAPYTKATCTRGSWMFLWLKWGAVNIYSVVTVSKAPWNRTISDCT